MVTHGEKNQKDQYPNLAYALKSDDGKKIQTLGKARPATLSHAERLWKKAKCTLNQDNEFYYRVTPSESKTILKQPGVKAGGKF